MKMKCCPNRTPCLRSSARSSCASCLMSWAISRRRMIPKLSDRRNATPLARPEIASSSRMALSGSNSALIRRVSQWVSRRSTFSATAASAMSSTKTVIFGTSGSSPLVTRPIASVPHINPPWSVTSISVSGER